MVCSCVRSHLLRGGRVEVNGLWEGCVKGKGSVSTNTVTSVSLYTVRESPPERRNVHKEERDMSIDGIRGCSFTTV